MLAEFSHATAKSQNSSELELCVEHVGHHGKVMAKSWQSHGNVENLYGLGETGSSRVAALSRLLGCVASVCTSISSADRRLVEGTTWT